MWICETPWRKCGCMYQWMNYASPQIERVFFSGNKCPVFSVCHFKSSIFHFKCKPCANPVQVYWCRVKMKKIASNLFERITEWKLLMWYEIVLTQRSNWWFHNMAVTVMTSFVGKKQILPVFSKCRKQTSMRFWPHPHSCSRFRDSKFTQMCGFIVTSKGFWVGAVEPSAQLRGRIRN